MRARPSTRSMLPPEPLNGSPMADPEYELFAIRYATRDAQRREHFIGGDPHDEPKPMDYFMWLARGGGGSFFFHTRVNFGKPKQSRRGLPPPPRGGARAV